MSKKSSFLLVIVLFAGLLAYPQKPSLNVSGKKYKTGKTFYDIQKEFYDHWAPYNVKDGYYTENGVRKKAAGWKQFKRWEYYWENRVDRATGNFPAVDRADIRKEIRSSRGTTSSNGFWSELGPSSSPGGYYGIGRFNCIQFRAGDNNTYYAGSPSGGLWKTTDNGSTWTALTDDNDVLGVSDLVVLAGATTASDTIYIATGDRDGGSMWTLGGGQSNDNNGIGVLKSTDGGTTWSATGLNFDASEKVTVNRIIADPANSNTLYAATSSSAGGTYTGFFKTTDGGASWTKTTANMYVDMELKPGDPLTIYAATKIGMIYKSTDGGTSWTKVLDDYNAGGRRIELAVSSNQPAWLYAVESNNSSKLFAVYKSTDSGTTFTKVYDGSSANHNLLGLVTDGSGTTGQGGYDLALACDPTDANTLFLGGIITFKSTDGGSSWTAVNCWTASTTYNKNGAPVVHADKHMLRFRSSDNSLFETNDGGIYITQDGGTSWTDKTNGTVPSQLYRIGLSQTLSSEVIAGLQDNGTKYLSGGNWSNALGGDGMECIIDYTDANTQYGCYQNGDIKRTTNHWSSSTRITKDSNGNPANGLTETGYWVTPYVIDPNNHLTLYAGMNNVWKSTDQGASWTKISAMNSSSKIRSIAVAPSNSQYIYAADPSHLWRTTDGGANWSNITGTLPVASSSITYITVKNDDENCVWVSMGQYNSDGVFETTDGGSTWTNISAGLPQIPVMCVIQDTLETDVTELYAGTDLGVYIKRGAGNWSPFNNGLPNVVVNELEIYYDNSFALCRIRAATRGRGLWESELYTPPNSPPISEFKADIRVPETNQTVSFTDLSINIPTSWKWSFSPSSVTFVNGTSSISENPEVQFTATGYYEVKLTATNANGSDSTIKTDYIRVSNYCAASGGGGTYINNVTFGSINNNTGYNPYTDYDNLSNKITVGTSNPITVKLYSYYNILDSIAGWIDWNHDGDFDDDNELVFKDLINDFTMNETVTVPADAKTGYTKMRVRNMFNTTVSPCGASSKGEVEDYTVNVLPGETVWTGNTAQWDVESNWSNGVIPTMSYNVTIPASPSGGNFPVIPNGYTAKCNKINLENGATITINGVLQVNQ